MADDELIIPIEKAYWPRGAMRSLPPLLRSLGDKHGNLVIAAVPNKHILVKGLQNRIEEAKPGLKALLEEHFPDAPLPPELGGEAHEEEGPPAPEPEAPKPPLPAPTEPSERAKTSGLRGLFSGKQAPEAPPVVAAAAAEPMKPMTGRKRPRSSVAVPAALLWECTRRNSSFIRNPLRQSKMPFSAEPNNLLAFHAARFSGVGSTEVLDVRLGKTEGQKEKIELTQSHAKASRLLRPETAVVITGLSKCPKKGLRQIDTELLGKYYRKDLHAVAREKYVKVQRSFKKTKVPLKSRRQKK